MHHWILTAALLLVAGPLAAANGASQGVEQEAARPVQADEAREALLARVDALEAEGRSDEILTLLEPYADGDDPELLGILATTSLMVATGDGNGSPVIGSTMQPTIDYARRAAELGEPLGWNLLWIIHSHGMGVEVDAEQAAGYLRAGAEGGDPGAMLNLLEELYAGTPFFERDVDAACAVYGQLLAQDVDLPEPARFIRARMITEGECGLEADPAAALLEFRQLAEAGDANAQRMVGLVLFYGQLAEPDPAAALPWFEQAAAQGDAAAMWQLGTAYATGQGVERDDARALHWFRQGADIEFPPAIMSLGVMHATGAGMPQDFSRAKDLYERAAIAGETHALRNLAVMHVLGQGTPPDAVQAQLYYLQHLHAGNEETPDVEALLEAHLDADERAEAQQRFEDWLALQEILAAQ